MNFPSDQINFVKGFWNHKNELKSGRKRLSLKMTTEVIGNSSETAKLGREIKLNYGTTSDAKHHGLIPESGGVWHEEIQPGCRQGWIKHQSIKSPLTSEDISDLYMNTMVAYRDTDVDEVDLNLCREWVDLCASLGELTEQPIKQILSCHKRMGIELAVSIALVYNAFYDVYMKLNELRGYTDHQNIIIAVMADRDHIMERSWL